ncbi:MAG: C39 family peptidase [Propionibacteriaceae bacterium]|nr:C39 family peptidase [Propionibacteriaceae bacterium]
MKKTAAVGLAAALAWAAAAQGAALPAQAQGVPVGGVGQTFYLNDQFTGAANVTFEYGTATDTVYFGDWNGDGVDTPMIRRGNEYLVRNSNTSGGADLVFNYGNSDDVVLVGDWDGDGIDTVMVRRGNAYYVNNSNATGTADVVFRYGNSDDVVLVGDWDGDGIDTLTVRRGGAYHVSNSNATGTADHVFWYGNWDDTVLVGDWNGDGVDTLGVVRGNHFFLRNSTTTGVSDIDFYYGNATDRPFAGDFNGDGRDTIGVRRPPANQTFDAAGNHVATFLDVAYISQLPELPTGCEATAVAMLLTYAGDPTTKFEVAAEMPYNADPNKGFQGDPATASGGVIYPPALLALVKSHVGSAQDLTGVTLSALLGVIDAGKPVVVWLQVPSIGSHTVVVTGYDAATIRVHDPIRGANLAIARATFAAQWAANGGRALTY